MKAKHIKRFDYSQITKNRNLFLFALITATILCLSGIGISTANGIEGGVSAEQNNVSQPIVQETNPAVSYSDISYYLAFTAVGEQSQVTLKADQVWTPLDIKLWYSDDDCVTWNVYEPETTVNINANATVYFKGDNPEGFNSPDYRYYYFKFKESTSINVAGCLLSLLGEESVIQGVIPPRGGCFLYLFINCKEIKNISENLLKVKSLSDSCFVGLFKGCSGLTSIPVGLLPCKNLSNECYEEMFSDCEGLTSIPEQLLPSEQLSFFCYDAMFQGCTGLTSVPEGLLHPVELASGCYAFMFFGCKNLQRGPDLPAVSLNWRCYLCLFANCEKLNYVKADFEQWADDTTSNWLAGVAANGTFDCKNCLKQPTLRSDSNIPETWQIIPENYMTYSTSANTATLSYSLNFNNIGDCNIYYSKDLITWSQVDVSAVVTKQELATINNVEHLYMYGGNLDGLNSDTFLLNFICEENLSIEGSVMALLGPDEDTIPNDYCFRSLFENCTGLIKAPTLPASNLKEYCYANMFKNCSSLNKAPYLRATDLKDSCYLDMFNGCTNMEGLKVEFTKWYDDPSYYEFDNPPTKNWLINTNSEEDASKFFYCPPDLDTASNPDESHVPNWWTVKKDTLIEAEVTGVNITYDAQVHSIQVNVTTIGEFVPQYKYGDDDWKTTNYEFSEVGTYTVFVKIEKENYQTFEGSADVVINKNTEGQLSIVDCTKTYGDDDPNFAVQSSGFVGGYIPAEGWDFVVFRDKGEDVKPAGEWYTIHAYWINNNSNFEIAPAEGKMTITKANATLVAEEKSKLDNAEDPNFTAHMNGLVHGGDVLDAAHYTITKQQNADGSISLSPALTAEGQQAFLGNYNVTYESALLKTYTNDEKVIVVPEYINVPGESSEASIAQTQINNSNEENKEKTAFGKTNSDNDNESANGTDLALTLSLIANGLLIAFGIILFLKFKTRIFK